MKVLILILLLAVTACAQNAPDKPLDWKLINEMSGEIPDYAGLTIETYAAQIARGDDLVRLRLKFTFPNGSPANMLRKNVPIGFDPSSIASIEGGLELNCATLIVKPVKNSAIVYQFNGNHFKSKEPPFKITDGHLFSIYFCERGAAPPSGPPKLKPTP